MTAPKQIDQAINRLSGSGADPRLIDWLRAEADLVMSAAGWRDVFALNEHKYQIEDGQTILGMMAAHIDETLRFISFVDADSDPQPEPRPAGQG